MRFLGPAWSAVSTEPRHDVAELTLAQVPSAPGVYVWWRDNEPIYVGEAKGTRGLRGRIRAHLGTGVDLSRSTLRASVAVEILGVSRATARSRPPLLTSEDTASVNAWLRGCKLSWVMTASASAAHDLESSLRAEWLPRLNRL